VTGARVHVERCRELAAPAAAVNVFHHAATCRDRGALAVGSRVEIEHRFVGRRELRVARIARLADFADGGGEIGWGEIKAEGDDWFPHGQHLAVQVLGPTRCRLVNRLRGSFRLPGAEWWLVPWYRHVLPRILDAENAQVARAVERRG
jgi:hypothetical protein